MAYYVKVTPEVRNRILPSFIGTKAKDDNIILFQSDLNGVEGLTLSDRAKKVGGALLTAQQAKAEIDGTCEMFSQCYDPDAKKVEDTKVEFTEEEPATDEAEETETEEETASEATETEEETATEKTEETAEETSEESTTEETTEQESEVNNG
jgi:hypothetical protein